MFKSALSILSLLKRVFPALAVCLTAVQPMASAADVASLKTQLSQITDSAKQLEFLSSALKGESLKTKAALGAWLIESAPEASRKSLAQNVARTLVQQKDASSNSPQLTELLIQALPHSMVPSLAASVAIGATAGDPDARAQIAAAAVAVQPKYAPAIAGEIVAASPLESASDIACAIGMKFADDSDLADMSPEIAAEITRALLSKGPIDKIRPVIAHSVASLIVLLPGSINSNHDLITKIGAAVSAVISQGNNGLATTIVGISSAAMKSAAGKADIDPVLNSFKNTFRESIADPIIQEKLDRVVSQVIAGTSDKDITPLQDTLTDIPPLNAVSWVDPVSRSAGQSIFGGAGGGGGGRRYGSVVDPETNVVNR